MVYSTISLHAINSSLTNFRYERPGVLLSYYWLPWSNVADALKFRVYSNTLKAKLQQQRRSCRNPSSKGHAVLNPKSALWVLLFFGHGKKSTARLKSTRERACFYSLLRSLPFRKIQFVSFVDMLIKLWIDISQKTRGRLAINYAYYIKCHSPVCITKFPNSAI